MNKYNSSKIYLAGHQGMVGSRLYSILQDEGYNNIIYADINELDLRNQEDTMEFITQNKPNVVLLIAGKVGGIKANIDYPAEYLYDNLILAANVIEASRKNNVEKLIYLGSSCVYPRLAKQPMKEEYLLTGPFEPTNEAYAIGKVAGLKLCQYYRVQYGCNFVALMPPNLYGPGDHFNTERSHVISALISKIHTAKVNNNKEIVVWGSGKARREFLYVDDICYGIIYILEHYDGPEHINVGFGKDYSIKELFQIIKEIIGYEGTAIWDQTYPDGMPQKLMDSSKILSLGWKPKTGLEEGLRITYNYFTENCI